MKTDEDLETPAADGEGTNTVEQGQTQADTPAVAATDGEKSDGEPSEEGAEPAAEDELTEGRNEVPVVVTSSPADESVFVIRNVEVELPAEEIAAFAHKAADAQLALATIEGEKKEANAAFKSRIESATNRRDSAMRAIREGKTIRPVKCRVAFNTPKNGSKTLTRIDTGEVLPVETMSEDDCQLNLPLADGETTGETNDGAGSDGTSPDNADEEEEKYLTYYLEGQQAAGFGAELENNPYPPTNPDGSADSRHVAWKEGFLELNGDAEHSETWYEGFHAASHGKFDDENPYEQVLDSGEISGAYSDWREGWLHNKAHAAPVPEIPATPPPVAPGADYSEVGADGSLCQDDALKLLLNESRSSSHFYKGFVAASNQTLREAIIEVKLLIENCDETAENWNKIYEFCDGLEKRGDVLESEIKLKNQAADEVERLLKAANPVAISAPKKPRRKRKSAAVDATPTNTDEQGQARGYTTPADDDPAPISPPDPFPDVESDSEQGIDDSPEPPPASENDEEENDY